MSNYTNFLKKTFLKLNKETRQEIEKNELQKAKMHKNFSEARIEEPKRNFIQNKSPRV
ncbi:MAG TPA: hypothetical protein K8V00_09760 [Ligilactobacillus acidipiscis]|uniref:Uncharacterized protein n=1 Tax=Ligilactobacillus acidipiscis TaxID=89059 RepID=A0A921F9I7_9LACO|nr:hypothetical protein [Ligilactobacillus acidipiscis]